MMVILQKKFHRLAKFKKDILEKDTPLLFKVSNHVFGIAFIIMDIFIFYVNR